MLVLTRKLGETIIVDGKTRVTIVAVEGGKVRIGFTAPPEVKIARQELLPGASGPRQASKSKRHATACGLACLGTC